MSPRILITGGAGRLGTAVAARLHAAGCSVLATDVVEPPKTQYEFLPANLLDHKAVLDLLTDVDAVVHLGNHPGIGGTPSQVVFNENIQMNTNVFQGAAEKGVKRIIFASTLQLIGSHPDTRTVVNPPPPPRFPLDGQSEPNPTNLYALSKTVAEEMLRYYAERCGLDCVALRLPLLHHHEDRVGVETGAESVTDILEGFTGLSYADAAELFLAVLRADLVGYSVFMAGTAHRHRDFELPDLIKKFYPDLPGDLPDLIDRSAVTAATGWEISGDYNHPPSEDPNS